MEGRMKPRDFDRSFTGCHYFTPSEDNDRFCAVCGKYLTDESHFRFTDNHIAEVIK